MIFLHLVDYTEPHVYYGIEKHSLVSDMWSLGIVAHFALFRTNPFYLLLKKEDISNFLPTVVIRRKEWEQLGPLLQRIFMIVI